MLLLALSLCVIAAAPDDEALVRLSDGVAAQRAANETLADDVARERAASREEIAALERRRRELELRLKEARLVAEALAASAAAVDRAHDDVAARADAERAPVTAALARLRAHITALPFRSVSRGERCAVIERSIAARPALASAAALWPLLADEARLLSAQSRVRQPVVVDGKPVMAEVAQVGPLLFFRAGDGRVGHFVDGVGFVVDDDVEARQRLLLFFEAQRRDAAKGVFVLPVGGP